MTSKKAQRTPSPQTFQDNPPVCFSCNVVGCEGCRPYDHKKGGLQGNVARFSGRIADHEFPGIKDMKAPQERKRYAVNYDEDEE